MPISTHWYDAGQTILVQQFEGQWSLEEYLRLTDSIADEIVPDSPLHVIADFSTSLTAPTRILAGMRYVQRKLAQHHGVSIFLNPNTTLESYFRLAQHIHHPDAQYTYTASNLPEAVDIISAHVSANN